MARERMVTRTVTETVAEIMCLNVTTCEVSIRTFTYAGEFATNEELLKTAKKISETEDFKLVHINSASTKETLYGMSETDFIKLAKVLPPRIKSEMEVGDN